MSESDNGEGRHLDYKSLRKVTGTSADFPSLAQDCVCFANAAGGRILVGIEDDGSPPDASQRIDPALPDRLQKRIGELTVNVRVLTEVARHANGGEYVVLTVLRAGGVASTSDGRFFVRIGDTCRPVVGDEVVRLLDERPTEPWETLATLDVPRAQADPTVLARLVAGLRASDRVKSSVKEKSDDELLAHYTLVRAGRLTNLGVLLVGTSADRARLGTAPVVQAIKYDERGAKVAKYVWDDHTRSPIELVDAIWQEIADFREAYEAFVAKREPRFEGR